ncbi:MULTISPECIES: hypothetical protein [Sphingobacterium]|uniref:Lipid A biosynthesis acyltransferase n=1 Tax=Sphingobacterium populi TaxID=1812824 RepID=A0ABW5UAB8_9SPHI|nr:hypothetical protein [Sphingobacterium sp. CFCC 11742]
MLKSKSSDEHIGNITDKDSLEFALFSANIQHILNVPSSSEIIGIYERSKTFQKKQANWNPNNPLDKLSAQLFNTLQKTTFIATFHFGYYRSLVLKLVNDGYKVCIPVARKILDSQMSYYANVLGVIRARNIVLLDAEDSGLFFKIAKYSKLGYHTLCYLDGGSGVKTKRIRSRGSLVQVSLANGYIISKLAFLKFAYICNLSVILCIHSGRLVDIDCDNLSVKYYPVLEDESSDAYSRRIIHQLYSDFESFLIKNPEMWECWFYLHQSNLPKSKSSNWKIEDRLLLLF